MKKQLIISAFLSARIIGNNMTFKKNYFMRLILILLAWMPVMTVAQTITFSFDDGNTVWMVEKPMLIKGRH